MNTYGLISITALLGLLLTILAVEATSVTLVSSVRGELEAGNYSHFSMHEDGNFKLVLISLEGDADIYVCDKQRRCDYSNYDFQSITYGEDEVYITEKMKRPVSIASALILKSSWTFSMKFSSRCPWQCTRIPTTRRAALFWTSIWSYRVAKTMTRMTANRMRTRSFSLTRKCLRMRRSGPRQELLLTRMPIRKMITTTAKTTCLLIILPTRMTTSTKVSSGIFFFISSSL